MIREHERRANADRAWRMADAPVDHMTAMLAGIVAFRIEVQGMIAKSKLSRTVRLATIAASSKIWNGAEI
jgi:transcriptional regulator